MKIYLARHGETDLNKKDAYQGQLDIELNESGLAQAQALANFFVDKNINLLLNSPLKRSAKTAEIINQQLKIGLNPIENFKEIDFGKLEGTPVSADKAAVDPIFAKERYQSNYHKVLIPYPGGESYHDLYLRAFQAINQINFIENTLIVSHLLVNRVLRGILLGISLQELTDFNQHNNQVIEIDLNTKSEQLLTL